MPYFTYILQSETDGRFYIGHTGNIEERLQRHAAGRSQYTRSKGPWKLVLVEEFQTRAAAMLRESQLKRRHSREYLLGLTRAAGRSAG